nr:putative b3 domain-containing protein [Quercus suber]POE67057.1 putative b3 domain-containing protein [Quercus suber]
MEVSFMEPSDKVNQIVLRQSDMPKELGKKSSSYVMIKSWNEVVGKNDLSKKLNQVIQIWSFRVGNEDQLCLALVVVKTRENNEGASSSRQGRDLD